MARTVLAFYADQDGADRAMLALREAGFLPEQRDAAQAAHEIAGAAIEAAAVVAVDPLTREADARDLLMHAGAVLLQGHGSTGTPTGMSAPVEQEDPVWVRDGERAVSPPIDPGASTH